MYHPNVSADGGKPCIDILGDAYSPSMTMPQLLMSLQMFLNDPNPNPGVNTDASGLYNKDRAAFNATVRAHTLKHAAGAPAAAGASGADGGGAE